MQAPIEPTVEPQVKLYLCKYGRKSTDMRVVRRYVEMPRCFGKGREFSPYEKTRVFTPLPTNYCASVGFKARHTPIGRANCAQCLERPHITAYVLLDLAQEHQTLSNKADVELWLCMSHNGKYQFSICTDIINRKTHLSIADNKARKIGLFKSLF